MQSGSVDPLTKVRRKDRAVEDESWIRAFLHRAPLAFLATSQDGQPFINSNTFVYDETRHAIFMHTARQGRLRENVEANPLVCFTVAEMGRLLPADTAMEFSVEYAGVSVFGRASIVTDGDEAKRVLQLLLDKYFAHLRPGRDYAATTDDELSKTAVYRIDIDQWVGKRKSVEPEFPGAFYYGKLNNGEPVA